MRVFKTIVLCAALLIASVDQLSAREWLGPKSNDSQNGVKAKAAGCSPAQTITEFYVNNVRTSAETGGNTWYDRGNGLPYYEIPADEGNHAVFAGALWMGGIDPAGNLKLAAIRFRQVGNDFWPGPLSIDGTASTTAPTCTKWDEFFLMSRQMVELHRYYFTLLAQGLDPLEDPLFENGYQIPTQILEWPAHGDVGLGQSFNIAPFADLRDPVTRDIITIPGLYEPDRGDYPLYDLEQEIDCRLRLVTDPVPLFGDFTMYWVFNDNGNIHTESQGQPIGMEVQGQMFGFTTNDEINNMTFCNYVLINRGTLTLQNTFFCQWVDTDLGNANDDFVGCDVGRGLGYSYNGDNNDEGSTSGPGYGEQPPAIGIDFFEGPYQDADEINNLVGIGFNEALNGLGYLDLSLPADEQDSIIDNERFGMRRFLYHSNTGQGAPAPTTDPTIAIEYYNMMRGIWRDGTPMTVGGLGYNPTDLSAVQTDFMFPGTSDPLFWGTQGIDPNFPDEAGWTEETSNNPAGDRRFLQSAGPFTLLPGQFNNITVGVVYARALTGGPFASVRSLLTVDDKAQALFENCFRLLDGPDAPDITFQELDKEIILYIRNSNPISNNRFEAYEELDPTIPPMNTEGEENDRFYRFQGYQIYQLRSSEVSISDLENPADARIVFQCDVVDGVGQIVNFIFDEEIGLPVPVEQVNGADAGIQHSVRLTQDLFASGDNRLVNFKKYYYVAVAYGYNNYEEYDPNTDQLTGQSRPYLRGRSGAAGAIQEVVVIPHKPIPEEGGTIPQSQFGEGFPISRIEGAGNGGNELRLTQETIDNIMSGSPYKSDVLVYEPGFGPLNVKVVDPLNVKSADFELRFYNEKDANGLYVGDMENARWYLVDKNASSDTIFSETSIKISNEQIIPEYGISVDIGQYAYVRNNPLSAIATFYPDLLNSDIEFLSGPADWLTGISDVDGLNSQNWIRSGSTDEESEGTSPCFLLPDGTIAPFVYNDHVNVDDDQIYEGVVDGILAPARLAAAYNCGPSPMTTDARAQIQNASRDISVIGSISLIITPDKSKWTRGPVFEMQTDPVYAQFNAEKLYLRGALSVDKNGRNQLDPGANLDECTYFGQQVITQAYLDGLSSAAQDALLSGLELEYPQLESLSDLIGLSLGMGWFPGYAVNHETGERQNIGFGENSFLSADNGRDMLWNPSPRVTTPLGLQELFGGEHYVYVFRNEALRRDLTNQMPMYDGGQFAYSNMNGSITQRRNVYRGMDWVMFPMLTGSQPWLPVEDGLVPGEVHITAKVAKPYEAYATAAEELGDASLPYVSPSSNIDESDNQWYPYYEFSTKGFETITQDITAAESALDLIDVVPNPYFAYSAYESSRVDNRVKFINLPQECKIQIFTLNGTLIRIFEKDNPLTFLEWDLQNEKFIPIAGGMYLVHIQVPGVGERVVKFFAATRPTDLRNF